MANAGGGIWARLQHLLSGKGEADAAPDLERALHVDIADHVHDAPSGWGADSPTALSSQANLFHDGFAEELRVSRSCSGRNCRLQIETSAFSGTFISVVHSFSMDVVTRLTRNHLVTVSAAMTCDPALAVYGRLNLRSGPNTEQVLREMPIAGDRAVAAFDLAYTRINEQRMERVWLDLIFESPGTNRVVLRDLTVELSLRAGF